MGLERAVPAGSLTIASILWRRVDNPGHDTCRLVERNDGWTVEGAAVLQEAGEPVLLAYRLMSDHEWRTVEGQVLGWIGPREIVYRITRQSGGWVLNGASVPDLAGCVDLDLGFTPATNLLQIRRINLGIGEGVDVPVAWLDVAAGSLAELHQRYERRSPSAYWYEAPRFDYKAMLEVDSSGFVRSYPGLWEAET